MATAPIMLKVRATLLEMWNRITPVSDKDKGIIWNGYNNLYPDEVDAVIYNSPTARRSSQVKTGFIVGSKITIDGADFDPSKARYFNFKKHTIQDLVNESAASVTRQRGVFVWVGKQLKGGKIANGDMEVLDFKTCRIGVADANDGPGKIYVKDWSKKEDAIKNKTRFFYPYSDNEDVIIAQMRADYKLRKNPKKEPGLEDLIGNFRGQIFYLNLDKALVYPNSQVDGGVYNECDTEYRITVHTNGEVRSGFLGKVCVLTNGIKGEIADKIAKDIKNWLGSENSAGMYHLDIEQTDDLEKVLKIIQVKPQYDEKVFIETSKRIKSTIFGAFNNIPEQLVTSSGSALFGTQEGTYEKMVKFYNNQTATERREIIQMFNTLGVVIDITPLTVE